LAPDAAPPPDPDLLGESAQDLYENAPCGYLACSPEGLILRVNRTFESWTGHDRETLVGRPFHSLLTPAGQIYHETHYAPLLQMQGAVREIALEIVRADGSRLPALVNSVRQPEREGRPAIVRTTIFDATDRRRYEQELLGARRRQQDIALELQRSLLSGALPEGDALQVAVVYEPAVTGLEVGGDWYDAFRLPGEKAVALVVGDVVGRGVTAAATMGQLRSATRALAGTGLGPAALLDALDEFVARHDVGRMTTVAYAELRLDTGAVRYACAGHPPPALLQPGREPELLWEGRSVPLDAGVGTGARPEAGTHLLPGGSLLLYTDGLVERRSRPLGVGLDELLAELAAQRDNLPADLLSGVVGALEDDRHVDDLCVLLAHRPGGGAG